MTLMTPRARLICALFDMAQASENIDIFSLSEQAGLSVYRALATLDDLQTRGLCNARRLTLTLSGLAVARALTDDSTQSCPGDLPAAARPQAGAQRVA